MTTSKSNKPKTQSNGKPKPRPRLKTSPVLKSAPAKAYRSVDDVKSFAATSLAGSPWIRVKASGLTAWVPYSDFVGTNAARAKLKAQGILLLDYHWDHLCRSVRGEFRFPVRSLVEQPGWTGAHFAMPDGQVFGPDNGKKPVVLFNKRESKCAQSGTLEGWQRGIAPVLAGQHLATFALMVAFAAPLLRLTDRYGNFGFELAGPKGVGKSTLQQLAASAAGAAVEPSGRNYWISANATANALEELLIEHADMLMVIEETNLFAAGESEKNRASKLDELVFRLADGTTKGRHGGPSQARFRFVYLTSSNEPLAEVLAGHRPAVSAAASDRLLTLKITKDRPYGIFEHLPGGFESGGAMAKQLTSTIAKNHGAAMPHFLRCLVEARSSDEGKLRRLIQRHIDAFRRKAGVDLNNGSEARVADAFGLVYAAGQLAKAYGALPKSIRCGAAALAAYQLNRSTSGEPASMLSKLLALAEHPKTIRIDKDKPAKLSDEAIDGAPAFLRTNRSGSIELLLTPQALDRAFPMKTLLLKDPDAAVLLQHDNDKRNTVKRILGKSRKPERVYCFRLPAGTELPT